MNHCAHIADYYLKLARDMDNLHNSICWQCWSDLWSDLVDKSIDYYEDSKWTTQPTFTSLNHLIGRNME